MSAPVCYPGVRLFVFDHRRYLDDEQTPLHVTMRPATIIRWYGYRSRWHGKYPSMIDVMFDGDDGESRGHFAPDTVSEMDRVIVRSHESFTPPAGVMTGGGQ